MAETEDPKVKHITRDVISEEFMRLVDENYLDPAQRANFVLSILSVAYDVDEPRELFLGEVFWDLVCFATEYLGGAALHLENEQFTHRIKKLSRWVYQAHYNSIGEITDSDIETRREEYLSILERLRGD